MTCSMVISSFFSLDEPTAVFVPLPRHPSSCGPMGAPSSSPLLPSPPPTVAAIILMYSFGRLFYPFYLKILPLLSSPLGRGQGALVKSVPFSLTLLTGLMTSAVPIDYASFITRKGITLGSGSTLGRQTVRNSISGAKAFIITRLNTQNRG